ncbi:MAG: hypothetical protein V4649_07720 [Bacteroidota bacterium]
MKFRTILLLAVLFAAFLATSSCVKKYTCHCDITYSGAPGLPDSTFQEFDITDAKAAAKSKCEDETYEHEENGIKTKEECYLY